jgi:hypothetical protein
MNNLVVFQPSARLVAVVGVIGPPSLGDDPGGYGIRTELCPVLALEAFAPGDADPEYGAIIVHAHHICNTADFTDRSQVLIRHCPWPPQEDEERLKLTVWQVRESLKAHADHLRSQGELDFGGAGSTPAAPSEPPPARSPAEVPRQKKPKGERKR